MTAARPTHDPTRDQGDDAAAPEVVDTWPHGISREATMRISDVLASLRLEFPAISHSKLRFLEEQGLVEPVRTSSGYRKYSPADVERLRFVLIEQRDRYLPLKVIKDKLSALDEGVASSDRPLIPRLVARGGQTATTGRGPSSSDLLAAECGVPVALVEELVNAGVLRPDAGGRFDAFARDVVETAAQLGVYGIEARHLRTLRSAADRHVTLVDQVVSPLRGQQSPAARGQAAATASELGELMARLHTVWVRQGIDELPR
ncbi:MULTISPECIES: transcriptional regulator FtsR [Sanguibacter]|uniref:MerR family transcriptional regulator n=1 Tax=Sanguibacter inulinus TaxID=60922 RepID=A0A853EQ19_9MICO|nr:MULTISPECIES: MerR family transcriptional regulator [Sanguibacter]KQT98217.1 transcriptional regulator [Sanguibacter sp. Leaf3]MBF0721465.1 MerR family transcriptional regulator [Sanguibacter inulinus]NYS92610.1 MerR family transcriptional regulator [Sanguibacter inulinus]